ncbi:MAG: hypothetical protein ACK56I_34815, partial [bacterium]
LPLRLVLAVDHPGVGRTAPHRRGAVGGGGLLRRRHPRHPQAAHPWRREVLLGHVVLRTPLPFHPTTRAGRWRPLRPRAAACGHQHQQHGRKNRQAGGGGHDGHLA